MTTSTKSLKSLPSDIYSVLETGIDVKEDDIAAFKEEIGALLEQRLSVEDRKTERNTLRMSNFGTTCKRKLWYTVNKPSAAEKLNGKTRFKFLYGDLIEAVTLFLAKVSGHKVTGTQERMELHGVVGHRDAVIDGVLVDVKSASSQGMSKFKTHSLDSDDPFGYRDQLDLYREASRDDPLVTVKGEAAFLAVDKVNGDIVVDSYKARDIDYEKLITQTKDMVKSEDVPKRQFFPQADGVSGNYKLGTACSYCAFKKECWPGLRAFAYSNGPRYLTEVKRVPDVPEIKV